jgi:hypothetical protein
MKHQDLLVNFPISNTAINYAEVDTPYFDTYQLIGNLRKIIHKESKRFQMIRKISV